MSNSPKRIGLFTRSLMAVSIVAAGPVVAQSQSQGQNTGLEEIVVTAEHRESTLQETEISMVAFSADTIRELGISNAADIGEYTPNLRMTPQIAGRSGFSVTMRGVGNRESAIVFEPSVGLYMDGVLIAKNVGSLLDVVDMDRIEVLRGPQGTLYGRNTIGGAINVITKQPTDEFEGKLEATLGSEDQQDFKGMLNVPLLGADSPVGALSLRASAASLERDGLYENKYVNAPQKELQDKDRQAVLTHLRWQPGDALDVIYSYDRTEQDETAMPMFVSGVYPVASAQRLTPYIVKESDRPSSGSWDGGFLTDTEVEGHALNIDWRLSERLSLISITANRETDNFGVGDADGSPFPILATADDQSSEIFTQELRLVGVAFDSRLDYVVGAFYMDEEDDMDVNNLLGPIQSQVLADVAVEAWALYTQGTYALNDCWNLTLGVRYTDEDKEVVKTNNTIRSGVTLSSVPFPKAEASFDNWSPMVSLSYDWSDDVMSYAKVARGFQSGGFNTRDTNPADFVQGYDEENLTSYEIGVKSTFADQRVRLNAAAFFSDYDDKQINAFISTVPPRSVIRNAGVIEIQGLEVELLAALTENIDAGIDYGYTDPEYEEYEDDVRGDLSDVSTFPFTPEHTAHAFVAYQVPVGFGTLSARVDWSYMDSVTWLTPEGAFNEGSAYDLWNARMTISEIAGPADTRMRVSLWGKNLADEEYWNFGVDLPAAAFGYGIAGYGEERTYGVDLALEF